MATKAMNAKTPPPTIDELKAKIAELELQIEGTTDLLVDTEQILDYVVLTLYIEFEENENPLPYIGPNTKATIRNLLNNWYKNSDYVRQDETKH